MKSKKYRKVVMPFKIRREKLDDPQQLHEMVPGFSPVPLYDFLENSDNNDLDERACPFAQGSSKAISQDIAGSYSKFNAHIEKLK